LVLNPPDFWNPSRQTGSVKNTKCAYYRNSGINFLSF
jgi:hypothetical protein